MSSSLNIFQIDHHHHHYHDDQWCVLGRRRDDGVLNLGAKFAGNVAAQKPCIQQVMMMVIIIMVMVMIIAMVIVMVIRMVMVIMVMMMKMVRIMVMAVMIIMEPHSTSVILNYISSPYLCILHFEIWFQELKPIFSQLSAFSSGIHCEIFVGQLFDIVWLCQLLSEKDLPPLPSWSSMMIIDHPRHEIYPRKISNTEEKDDGEVIIIVVLTKMVIMMVIMIMVMLMIIDADPRSISDTEEKEREASRVSLAANLASERRARNRWLWSSSSVSSVYPWWSFSSPSLFCPPEQWEGTQE